MAKENTPASISRKYKVYYRHLEGFNGGKFAPQIKLSGTKLLKEICDLEIGDTLQVEFEKGKITIRKSPPNTRPKQKR